MGTDVEVFVAACKVCKESKDPPGMNATREPLKSLAAPSEPNERVHADLFTPWTVSAAGHKYVLVITDAFSKLAELVPLKDKEAGTVAPSSILGSVAIRHLKCLLRTEGGNSAASWQMSSLAG